MRIIELSLIAIILVLEFLEPIDNYILERLYIYSFLLLTFLYLLFGFFLINNISFSQIFKRQTYQHFSAKRIMGSIGIAISLFFLSSGICFAQWHLPGAEHATVLGIVSLVVAIVVCLKKSAGLTIPYYVSLIKQILVYLLAGLLLYSMRFMG